MSLFSDYFVPLLYALLVHGLVVAGLLVNWESTEAIEVTRVEPYYIEASLVNENPHKARERREASAAAARQQAARQQAAREAQQAKERAAREQARREAEAKQRRLEQLKAEQARKEREAQARREQQVAGAEPEGPTGAEQEQQRRSMEQQLARAIMNEQSARRAVTDDEKAMAYAAQIRQDIVRNWSRPPSARNGMKALLRVSLVPTGEVVDVSVVEGSGNDAFDRSAVLAVEKAERFTVPADSRQFERNFREFEVLFRPEDLRL